MKCLIKSVALLQLVTWSLVQTFPSEPTTARNTAPISDAIKTVTNQLMETNATSGDVETFDTRTPPRVKQQVKVKIEKIENSHAGVAIPMDASVLELEESTKKNIFLKPDKPTTNSGLSTWILLSGQNLLTTKPPATSRKPTVKTPEDKKNTTVVLTETPPKLIKPVFKKKTTLQASTTTSKSTTTTSSTPRSTTSTTTTKSLKDSPTKLYKVKASLLTKPPNKTETTTVATTVSTKKLVPVTTSKTKLESSSTTPTSDSGSLPLEAKDDGDLDLNTTTDSSKKRKTVTKRKKSNKNRRRKPSDKTELLSGNSTKIEKHKTSKDKPISTQFYNYLSREVMPTVGVGLVGLMVTAGLAGYFLYPFGIARRSYEIDRKDKEGAYYYRDEYSGGIAEEEAIGKVIAGMPDNTFYGPSYKAPSSRITYPKMHYHRSSEPVVYKGTVEDVKLTSKEVEETVNNNNNNPVAAPLKNNDMNLYQLFGYKSDEDLNKNTKQKFVVGNVPKEITEDKTPKAAPRYLVFRKRRSLNKEVSNEIDSYFSKDSVTTSSTTSNIELTTTTSPDLITETTTESIYSTTETLPEKYQNFINLMKDLFHLKVKYGLQLIQNATQTISKYVSKVQSRLDHHYLNTTME